MLKPVRYVDCSPGLRSCKNLQIKLIEFLCDLNIGESDVNQTKLQPPVIPTQIEADWLWKFLGSSQNNMTQLERAKTIAVLSKIDKAALLQWTQAVSQLPTQLKKSSLNWPTSKPGIPERAWKVFQELMQAFYKNAFKSTNGLPYANDGTPVAAKGLTYTDFVKMFRELHRQNPKPDAREVCVYCGGHLGETPEIDHWILESAYPLLSVCADNLVPVCGDCNSASNKGQKPVHTDGKFDDWFHPYLHHPKENIQISYELQSLSIIFSSKNIADATKVENLDKLLNLTKRWTRELKAEYSRQQGILIERERRRLSSNQPRHTQDEILVHLQNVQADLLPSEPHYEIHSVLCSAMLEKSRLDAWQTELGLVT